SCGVCWRLSQESLGFEEWTPPGQNPGRVKRKEDTACTRPHSLEKSKENSSHSLPSWTPQRFRRCYGLIAQHFRPHRQRVSAPAYRQERRNRFQLWQQIMTPALAA